MDRELVEEPQVEMLRSKENKVQFFAEVMHNKVVGLPCFMQGMPASAAEPEHSGFNSPPKIC